MTVIAALVCVLSVSTGAFAAKGLLTGAEIKNGSLTGADIKKRSLNATLFTAATTTSLRGPAGLRGAQGDVGASGPTGLASSNGGVGANGPAGTNGVAGTDGNNGLAGTAGTDGTDGLAGTAGTDGTNGLAGTAGTDGTNGLAGTAGTDGTDGTDGTVTPLSATTGTTDPVVLPPTGPAIVVVSLAVPTAGKYVVLAKMQLYQSGAGDAIECVLKANTTSIDQVAMKTLPALAEVPVSLQAVATVAANSQFSVECDMRTADGRASFNSLIAIPTS
jgi:collagen triple helix repeat protein